MSRRRSVAGALPAFPVAAAPLLLGLVHDKTTKAGNHTANHLVKTLFMSRRCCVFDMPADPASDSSPPSAVRL
jgi:hypothetical protein